MIPLDAETVAIARRAVTRFDRLTMPIAPRWTLKRIRSRIAADLLARHYDSASHGRRTSGWRRPSSDANAAVQSGLRPLRDQARDLARNNSYAAAILATIADNVVGYGIVATPAKSANAALRQRVLALWGAWADTTACDADGRQDFAGLQKQVIRTVAESGECLVRRRWRRPEDGLPIPMQLQVLEPDYLDDTKNAMLPNGAGRIIQGKEFNPIGRCIAYWLYPEHPGASLTTGGAAFGSSQRVPASEILHIFRPERPGQIRGISWFAPIMLRLKDFDDYADAALMKQKIAACLAVILTDLDGSASPLGTLDSADSRIDTLEPGMIANFPAGKTATIVNPPSISEHAAYASSVLHEIATGVGVAYESMTGNFAEVSFSSARMSRLREWARVEDWRWRLLIPQLCDPVWAWAMTAAALAAQPITNAPTAEWTPTPMPMIEPDREGLAYQRNLRIGAITWPEMVRERGYIPDAHLAEIAEWNTRLDAAGIILDSDPRKTTQAGQPRDSTKSLAQARAALSGNTRAADATLKAAGEVAEQKAAEVAERITRSIVNDEMLRIAREQIGTLTASPTNGHANGHTVNITNNIPPAPSAPPAPPAPDVHVKTGDVHVAPAEIRFDKDSIHTEVHAPPAPEIHVDARTTVEATRPADILVDARTTIEPGAVRVDVAPPPPAAVTVEGPTVNVAPAEVRIEKGAVQSDTHLTVADTVNVPASRKRITRDAKGRITGVESESEPGTVITRDADGRLTGTATAEPDA